MPSNQTALRLHRSAVSGHCHRVELFLSILGITYEKIDVDMKSGAHKLPDFLEINPLGQVPVLEYGSVVLYDSNAILIYLANKFDDGTWLPCEPERAAQVQQWLSLAAGQIANGPAAARAAVLFGAPVDIERARTIAHNLLRVLERQFEGRRFAIGERPTIADLAAYGYIARAPEGGGSLDAYPQVRAWLERIAALPGFIPMAVAAKSTA